MLQKSITNMIGKNISLTDVIQVMLFRPTLPCQLQASHMWGINPEEPWTLKHFFGTAHEDIWKLHFKAQKMWPKNTEDIGLDIENPASEVSISFSEYPLGRCFN